MLFVPMQRPGMQVPDAHESLPVHAEPPGTFVEHTGMLGFVTKSQ